MRIALFGGVFSNPLGQYALSAPENVLLRFLREAGHDVVPLSIDAAPKFDATVDVYHANHFGLAAYGLLMAGAAPFVFTSHNPFLVSDFPVAESRIDRALQPRVFNGADAVVALSRREEELLRKRFALGDNVNFSVIPNGLDLGLYGPPERECNEVLEVVTAGQLVEYKGLEYLLRAAARIAATFPTLRVAFIGYRHDLQASLERLAAELGIVDRIRFEGPYRTPELVRRYQECAVYVQPSLAECFPVTVLEAMACGRPIVATNVGGVAEQLGDAGLVVPARDVEALASALGRLLSDEQERRRLGEAALARCRDLYDGRRVAALHVSLYEELAESYRHRLPSAARRAATRAVIAAMSHRGGVARLLSTKRLRRQVATRS